MDLLETYYDKQTFTLYALFVATPGKSIWRQKIFLVLTVLVLTFATTFQMSKLVIEGFKLQFLIEILPTIAATAGSLIFISYTATVTVEEYEELLLVMLNDLKEKRNVCEEAIKQRFAQYARYYIHVYTRFVVSGICLMPFTGFVPRFLDFLIPLNESRADEHIFIGEFFVDQREYYYHVYLFECCTAAICFTVVGVSENMSVIVSQHFCGMLAIVGHRLENITEVEAQKSLADYSNLITRELQVAIIKYQSALQFGTLAASFYDIPLTIVLISTFCALSVSLVHLTNSELLNLKVILYTAMLVCQFFIVSWMGQFLIDSSERYNAKWDICPPNTRRILQIIIMRSWKPCRVVARGMYTLSIENFMSVMQTTLSFYMVLRQAV